ncbi:hypothetical protein AMS68_002251 [Peltaster fructicola]|uniref:Glycosyltransferase family 8 protein n=1 Tax=Peltaster fructicola TaxID=286661 RepID=A0A6H0XPS8_9PEZI|nr:hypothetical protein AMS68_002251 [Peltaster fructicola]
MRLPRRSRISFICVTISIVVTAGLFLSRTQVYRDFRAANFDNFDTTRWSWQLDMPWYPLPRFQSVAIVSAPHNWRGPGHETFATFYASRDASMSDPYFLAAQQMIYRVLWDPKSKSKKYPITIFVAPFVPAEQRAYFAAAGALVRELPLRPFVPNQAGAAGRLRDMFSKLEMWRQTEFSKITYLDSDAFPLVNVDTLFDLAKEQTCREQYLPAEDKANVSSICKYTMAGYMDYNGVNAGVLVFNPNVPMYERLVRESQDQSKFDNGFMEQALLQLAYSTEHDAPFPPTSLDHAYNGGVDTKDRGDPLYIVHHKLWATDLNPKDSWWYNVFNETWTEMLDFYKSSEFHSLRLKDGLPSGTP